MTILTGTFTAEVQPSNGTPPPGVGSHPDNYEYTIERLPSRGTDEEYLAICNARGADGWKLLFITNIVQDDGFVRAWFGKEI